MVDHEGIVWLSEACHNPECVFIDFFLLLFLFDLNLGFGCEFIFRHMVEVRCLHRTLVDVPEDLLFVLLFGLHLIDLLSTYFQKS